MSVVLPFFGLLAGFILVYRLDVTVPFGYANYLAVAVLASLDTVVGGIRAGVEHRFESDIFVSGFFLNALAAGILAYFGDRIGVSLTLVATFVFGYRIFQNLSLIRTHWITARRGRNQPPGTGGQDPSLPAVPEAGRPAGIASLDGGADRRVA
jgi:small basic protein